VASIVVVGGGLAGLSAAFAEDVPHAVGVSGEGFVPLAGVGEAFVNQLGQAPLGVPVAVPAGPIAGGDLDQSLMFSGHNAYMFAQDPFYADGFIPTVQQLVERIQTGD
jgi:hypothetical protein